MLKAIAMGLGKQGVAASFGPRDPLGVRANFSELELGRTPASIVSIPEGLLNIEPNAICWDRRSTGVSLL